MSLISDGDAYNVSLSEYCHLEGCDQPTYRPDTPRYSHKRDGWYDGDPDDYYGYGEDDDDGET